MKISFKIPTHPHPTLFSSCEHALCITNWQLLIQLSYSYFFNILPMRPQNGSYIDLRFGLDYSSNYYLKKCTVYLEVSKNYIRSSLPKPTVCIQCWAPPIKVLDFSCPCHIVTNCAPYTQ
jgi:hypothetical protein